MELIHNPFFWAGQVGLLLIVVFGLAIIEVAKSGKLWYTFAVWLIVLSSLYCFGRAFYAGDVLPNEVFANRFLWGMACIAGYFNTRLKKGKEMTPALIRAVNRMLFVGGAVSLVALVGGGLWLTTKESNQLQERSVRVEEKQLTLDSLQVSVDTATRSDVRKEREANRLELKETKAGNARLREQIRRLDGKGAARSRNIQVVVDTIRKNTNPVTDETPAKKRIRLWPFGRRRE